MSLGFKRLIYRHVKKAYGQITEELDGF